VTCWLVSRRLSGAERQRVRLMTWVQVWLLLISAYVMLAIVPRGGSFLASHESADPSSRLVQ
jgi:hypothetical protein